MSLLARISGFKNYAVDSEAKDVEVPDPPNDSISSLSFSGAGELLAAGSWNNEVCSGLNTFYFRAYVFSFRIKSL